MNLILRWVFGAMCLLLIAEVVPGIEVTGLYPALITALVLGFFNVLIRPILFVLTLPITLLTLGLFAFVLNGLLFWFVSSFIQGFSVSGFWAALVGSLLMSLAGTLGNRWLKSQNDPVRTESKVVYKELRD
jgi:putative membrane protein